VRQYIGAVCVARNMGTKGKLGKLHAGWRFTESLAGAGSEVCYADAGLQQHLEGLEADVLAQVGGHERLRRDVQR